MRGIFLGILLFLAACQSNEQAPASDTEGRLFTLLSAKQTGVDFTNQIEDGPDFNILTYRNFYNGGGVAIGDINNDDLPDIFFTANMQPNKLYLNKGDFQFEDISAKAGIEGTKAWSTGVTMVDINADGWLDIYVCNSGDVAGDNKENELYINNTDGTFTERAATWGLNNQGFSTHASFFDYDQDGDLDCYLLNNSFKSPDRIELYKRSRNEIDQQGGDKLFRNEGNRFVDATQEAGIYSSDIGFGLGVSISDLNNDGLPDIYVSNDFWERDYLYLNKGDGTFSEELQKRTGLCSMSSMGADIADLNNDGAPEVMTTDMLPGDNKRLKAMTQFTPFFLGNMKSTASFHYQMLQNCLHFNDGAANFQELANLSGVAATDWSWGTLLFDFDNDGWKDIYVSNGILRDITDLDFADFIRDKEAVKEQVSQTKRADFRDFLPFMPTTKLANYAFINRGDATFGNAAKQLGLATPSFSNGAAYADLDNDGDQDIVVNNLNMPSFIYRNNTETQKNNNWLKIKFKGTGKNPLGVGAKVRLNNEFIQEQQNFPSRSFESCVPPELIFGLGAATQATLIEVFWPDGSYQAISTIEAGQTITVDQSEAQANGAPTASRKPALFKKQSTALFASPAKHQENNHNDFDHERLLPKMLSTEGPKIIKGDINNDKLEDFILLGAADDPDKLFLQQANGQFRQQAQPFFEQDKAIESTCGLLIDMDGDKDLDYLVGAGGNEFQKGRKNFIIRYYENLEGNVFFRNDTKAPPVMGNLSTMTAGDFDQDGDIDLFLGARCVPGNYGLQPASFVLENSGFNAWKEATPESMKGMGMITDATWADIDNDKDLDLIVVGDWEGVTIFVNEENELTRKEVIPGTHGWWNTLEVVDLDQDGYLDMVLGNWGLNTKFQASVEQPLTMYVKDFDKNRKSEFIINWYPPLETTAFPFPTKMDLTAQIPNLKKRALKYIDYSTKSYEELFVPIDREGALEYSAVTLASAIIWNEGESLKIESLPLEAQVAPVYSILTEDLDEDGQIDIWLGGNIYGLKPEVGRQAANHGVFLKGASDRRFTYLPPTESGIRIEGQVRDAITIKRGNKEKTILVARNNDTVEAFVKN